MTETKKSEGKHFGRIDRGTLALSFHDRGSAARREVLTEMGPLAGVFERFWQTEADLDPMDDTELGHAFDLLGDPQTPRATLSEILHRLAPGSGRVGYRQVISLTERLRARVHRRLAQLGKGRSLRRHDHAFGSGGDFCKTGHATTYASIVAAPALPILKTGTTHVTAEHGSLEAIKAVGYSGHGLDLEAVDSRLHRFGFAYLPLSDLGLEYSEALRAARRELWNEAVRALYSRARPDQPGWKRALRETQIPLDVFKVVSPNAQVLDPEHHSTGVCHPSMIPYVAAIFLHLGTVGYVAHAYDGIDELSNASSDPAADAPSSIVLKFERDRVVVSEIAPEELGLARARLADIREETTVEREASGFWNVLSGADRGPRRDFIAANAGLLFAMRRGRADSRPRLLDQINHGIARAFETIDSGAAEANFRSLIAASAASGTETSNHASSN